MHEESIGVKDNECVEPRLVHHLYFILRCVLQVLYTLQQSEFCVGLDGDDDASATTCVVLLPNNNFLPHMFGDAAGVKTTA